MGWELGFAVRLVCQFFLWIFGSIFFGIMWLINRKAAKRPQLDLFDNKDQRKKR